MIFAVISINISRCISSSPHTDIVLDRQSHRTVHWIDHKKTSVIYRKWSLTAFRHAPNFGFENSPNNLASIEYCHISRNLANVPWEMRSFPTGGVLSPLEMHIPCTHFHISQGRCNTAGVFSEHSYSISNASNPWVYDHLFYHSQPWNLSFWLASSSFY